MRKKQTKNKYFCILASAIKCYQCNSKLNAECKDIGAIGNGILPTNNFTEFYKDCDVDLEGRKPFCRKIQTLGNTYI